MVGFILDKLEPKRKVVLGANRHTHLFIGDGIIPSLSKTLMPSRDHHQDSIDCGGIHVS
jgi:hypothetical protein